MQEIKWYERTWVIILCLLLFAPLGLFLILRSRRHKAYIKIIFIIIFLVLLPLFFSFNFMGIPLYYFDYSSIASAPPLPAPEKIEESKLRQGKIYMVPIDKVDKEFVKKLIPYIEERFRYKTEVASPLETEEAYWRYNRALLEELEKYPAPPDAVRIIGITNLEILDWDVLKEHWRSPEERLERTLHRELYYLSRIYPYFPKPVYHAFYYALIGLKVRADYTRGVSNVFWLSDVVAPGKVAFISLYRLKEPIFFWKNQEALLRRAVTEITFLLGQSFGFTDCPHKDCAMKEHYDRTSILDKKKSYFCLNCKQRFETMLAFHDYLIMDNLQNLERFATQSIEKDPEDGAGHAMLGLVYKEKSEYQKAEHELRKAVMSSPENEVALCLLGEVYYARSQESLKRVQAIQDYIDEEPEIILTSAKRNLMSDPENPTYRMLVAFAYFKMKDYDKADKELSEIEEKIEMKDLRLAINEMKWAEEKYEQACEINRFLPQIFYNYGLGFADKKEYEKAIKFYQQTIRINEKHAKAHTNLGWVYHDIKEYKKAVKTFRKALEVDPDHTKAYLGLGKTYASLGDFEKAKDYFKECLRLDTSCAFVYFYLGLIYEKEGSIEKAIESYENFISLKGKEGEDFQGNKIDVKYKLETLRRKGKAK